MEDRIAVSRFKQGDLSGLESPVVRYQVQAGYAAYLIVYDRPLAEDGIWFEMTKFGNVESISYLDQAGLIALAESMVYNP